MNDKRHYEIVLIIDPDRSEQVPETLKTYRKLIEEKGGVIHREEDWGRKILAYGIAKKHKAHYVLLNIECQAQVKDELSHTFRFNDSILRHLFTRVDGPITANSAMMAKEIAEKSDQDQDKKHSANKVYSKEVHYANVQLLRRYILETGRIIPCRINNVALKKQRSISHAIKVARFLSLLPYCDRHV